MLTLSVYLIGDCPQMNARLAAQLEARAVVKVVATAQDEPDAVQWLARQDNDADLVIVDLFLKAGSGLGVLRRAREASHRRHFVVLSNFAGDDLRRTSMALGASQVFDKTTEIDLLLAYCENFAAGITLH